MHPFDFDGLEETVQNLKGNQSVTVDLDASFGIPGTGTPEAGGVTFLQLLRRFLRYVRIHKIVGCEMWKFCVPAL